ncbi:MAG: TonB family protein [Planctomycetota bacterium]
MNFAQRQRDPRRHLVGFTAVILFHGFIVYALVTGLAKKVVEVVRAPIETKVIEEVKKPPPPPEIVVPPPPRLEAPPPPFIPPPEVQIATPPPPQPTITAVTPEPPPAPVEIAPAPPPVIAPPPPVAPPAPVTTSVACPRYRQQLEEAGFPREAHRARLERGDVTVQFTVGPNGEIKEVKAVRSTHPIFARYAVRTVQDFKCIGQARDTTLEVPIGYKLQ